MLITEESVVRPSTSAHPNAAPKKRWAPWLWLGVGGALLPFTIFAHVVPIATWLAPVFLMRFVRTTRAAISLPIIGMLGYLAVLLVLWDIVPTPGLYVFALPAGLTMIFTYGADRLLARRIGGVLGTLVFPATDTALNFLPGVISRDAFAVGAAAYTQASELSLIQLVSVTGLWGLNFLIAWLAPVANDLWEKGFNVRQVWRSVAIFLSVLTAVLLFGGARLAFFPPTATTVRVAALAPDRDLNDAAANDAPLGPRPLPAATRNAIREQYLDPVAEDLFARTTQAARSGAKIVVWSEAAAFVFKEDEASYLERAQSVARQEHIYLQIGLVFLLPTDRYPTVEIRAIMIDPNGSISWDYSKATEVFTDGNQPGPWRVPTLDTPYGRLATVICYDADFPQLVRQAGKAGTDILLVPSSDWSPIAEPHSRMAIFRAVENGVALVRPTRLGTSIASDHQGRLLGYKSDYFVGTDHTMIVNVPTSGGATLYALVGESVGWLCVVGMLGLAGFAGVRKIQSKGAGAALN